MGVTLRNMGVSRNTNIELVLLTSGPTRPQARTRSFETQYESGVISIAKYMAT
jgi:hypothetical protein